MSDFIMLSMPAVLFALCIYCATQNWNVINRFSIATILFYLVVNGAVPIARIHRLNQLGFDFHLDRNIFIFLSVMFLISVLLYLVGFGVVNARHVIVLHPTYRADEILIDTKTGKVWQTTLTNQGGELFWQQMRFTNFDSKKDQRYWDTLPR